LAFLVFEFRARMGQTFGQETDSQTDGQDP